jgi:RNA polymerase sigma factor (sigma-70 family)
LLLPEFRQRIAVFDENKIKWWLWKHCRRRGVVLEDLTQEVCARLIAMATDPERVLQIRDLDKYVYGLCWNVAMDRLREMQKSERMAATVRSFPGRATRTPETLMMLEQDLKRLQEQHQDAVDELPKRQRQIYLMHHVEGYSIKLIATTTGLRIGTVKRTLYDAMRSVRRNMVKEETVENARSLIRLLGSEE